MAIVLPTNYYYAAFFGTLNGVTDNLSGNVAIGVSKGKTAWSQIELVTKPDADGKYPIGSNVEFICSGNSESVTKSITVPESGDGAVTLTLFYTETQSSTSGTVLSSINIETKETKYTISYDSSRGTVPGPKKVAPDSYGDYALTEEDLPELKDARYAFLGWWNGDTQVAAGTLIQNDMTLTAHWKYAVKHVRERRTVNGERYTIYRETEAGLVLTEDGGNLEDKLAELARFSPVVKTAGDAIAVAGTQYYLGEQAAVTITLPDDAQIGQAITVCWYNGAAAAALSVTGNMLPLSYTPSPNSRSEIKALWDGRYWAVESRESPLA